MTPVFTLSGSTCRLVYINWLQRNSPAESLGPHGIPIEGEWYTGTFRDVFFGLVDPRGHLSIETRTVYDVGKRRMIGRFSIRTE